MRISEVRIDPEAVRHNLASLKELVPNGMQVAAVVKGNAYGHGLAETVSILDPLVDLFQVDDIEELIELRKVTQRRAMVLGYVGPDDLDLAVKLGAELALYDRWQLEPMAKAKAKVHLEVDALLGRLGVHPASIDCFLDAIEHVGKIAVVGAYGHFANIEDTTDQSHAYAQIEVFEDAFARIKNRFPDTVRHMSATSGLLTIEPIRRGYGMVRLGIGLYGMYPSVPLARTHAFLELRPAMKWVTKLAQVKQLPARHPVGYGLAYVTPRDTTIGIVPVGYSDGYDRGLSNCGEVIVRGQRAPVIGRIAMNMFAVDLSGIDSVEAGDDVVLLGSEGSETISAEEIASRIGTINYEVTSRIPPTIPRVVT